MVGPRELGGLGGTAEKGLDAPGEPLLVVQEIEKGAHGKEAGEPARDDQQGEEHDEQELHELAEQGVGHGAALLDPHPAAEAFFVRMVEHEARFGVAPAVVAGAVVEVHEPEAFHLEPAAHHGLGPLAHDLVQAVLGVLDPAVASELLDLQVGGLGEAPDLGEELRRLLVREDRLFRELLGHGGIVAEEPPAS